MRVSVGESESESERPLLVGWGPSLLRVRV